MTNPVQFESSIISTKRIEFPVIQENLLGLKWGGSPEGNQQLKYIALNRQTNEDCLRKLCD